MRKQQIIAVMEPRRNKVIFIMAVAIIVLVVAVIIIWKISAGSAISDRIQNDAALLAGSKSQAQVVENHTSIDKVVGINELQTLRYDYQAICRVYKDANSKDPVYYIAYEATVVLGIDADQISSDYKIETNTYTIRLPQVKIQSMTVNAGTIDYLFVDKSYDNMQTSIEAQSRCEEDLKKRVEADSKMFEYARHNTEAEIQAITEPIVKQFYPGVKFEIVWKEG
jgi:hypothetical protein